MQHVAYYPVKQLVKSKMAVRACFQKDLPVYVACRIFIVSFMVNSSAEVSPISNSWSNSTALNLGIFAMLATVSPGTNANLYSLIDSHSCRQNRF